MARIMGTYIGDNTRSLRENLGSLIVDHAAMRMTQHMRNLQGHLSGGSRGGIKHDFLPEVSSAENSTEWPQQQAGNLSSSVTLAEPFPKNVDEPWIIGYVYDNSVKMTYDSTQTSPTLIPLSRDEFDEKVMFLEFDFFSPGYGPLTRYFETEKLFREVETKYGGSG